MLRSGAALVLVGFTMPAAAQTASDVRMDAFYVAEFADFASDFQTHVDVLDACLKELDALQTNFLLETPQCQRHNEMRPDAKTRMDELRVVTESWHDWLVGLAKRDPNDDGSWMKSSMDKPEELLRLYLVKFQQAQVRSQRIQQQQKELVQQVEELEELVRSAAPAAAADPD